MLGICYDRVFGSCSSTVGIVGIAGIAGVDIVEVDIVGVGIGSGSSFGSIFGGRRFEIGSWILVGFYAILVSILLIFLCIRMDLFL